MSQFCWTCGRNIEEGHSNTCIKNTIVSLNPPRPLDQDEIEWRRHQRKRFTIMVFLLFTIGGACLIVPGIVLYEMVLIIVGASLCCASLLIFCVVLWCKRRWIVYDTL